VVIAVFVLIFEQQQIFIVVVLAVFLPHSPVPHHFYLFFSGCHICHPGLSGLFQVRMFSRLHWYILRNKYRWLRRSDVQ